MAEEQLTTEQITVCFKIMEPIEGILLSERYRPIYLGSEQSIGQAKAATITHHLDHLNALGVQQTDIDPFKILSWFAFELRKQAGPTGDPHDACLMVCINAMNRLLEVHCGQPLDDETIRLIYLMTVNDGKDDDFGIGRNGLFMAFHTCTRMVNNCHQH